MMIDNRATVKGFIMDINRIEGGYKSYFGGEKSGFGGDFP